MIVAIDGPAGAGKSSVARLLAQRLGFAFLDTGAMYRAVAYEAKRIGIDLHDDAALLKVARESRIELTETATFVNSVDVSREIRTPEITGLVRFPADHEEVRAHLVSAQRAFASGRNTVTEGRDQGTVAFPRAECKIFLTATPEERARRRWNELAARGETLTFEEVLRRQNLRDFHDETRDVGRLAKATDAVEFFTDGLSTEQVVDQLESLVRRRLHSRPVAVSGA